MKLLFVMLMSLLMTQVGYGQEEAVLSDTRITNALTLSPGLDYISLKDQTFSPIVFTGFAPKINIGFSQNRNGHALWHADLAISVGNIDYENEYFESTYVSAQLSLNYLSIIKSNRKSKIYVGGQFRSALNLLEYESFASGSWFTTQQLEPIILYKYEVSDKQSITGNFSFPIIGLIGRPSYAGIDEFVVINSENISKILYSRLQIQSFNKLINPNFELVYSYNFRRSRFSISANYSYLQVNSIRKYFKHEFGINVGFHLKIGRKNEE